VFESRRARHFNMQLAAKAADTVSERGRVIKSRGGREPKQLLVDLPLQPGGRRCICAWGKSGACCLLGNNRGLSHFAADKTGSGSQSAGLIHRMPAESDRRPQLLGNAGEPLTRISR